MYRACTILIDWKTQYCQDVNSAQTDLQIQCKPNQNPSRLFLYKSTAESKINMEMKMPKITKTTLKKRTHANGVNLQ